MKEKMKNRILQAVSLINENVEVVGVVLGPINDVRSSRSDVQTFATDFGNVPVRFDKDMGPDDWGLVMTEPNWEKKKAEAVKELTKDLYSFLEILKNPTIVYRNEDIHEQLTRAVLILLERAEKK